MIPIPPQYSLALEEILQAQQALLPLWPVGAGAVVQDLRHVLRLAQIMGDATVPWAVRALRAGAGRVAVGVVIRVHPWWFVPPPQRLPLQEREEQKDILYDSRAQWCLNVTQALQGKCLGTWTQLQELLIKGCQLHHVAMLSLLFHVV